MISKVTVCPFIDTEHLAQCAETGMEPYDAEIDKIFKTLKGICDISPQMVAEITRLDDLFHTSITAAQNETIRNTVCLYCDNHIVCHPPE